MSKDESPSAVIEMSPWSRTSKIAPAPIVATPAKLLADEAAPDIDAGAAAAQTAKDAAWAKSEAQRMAARQAARNAKLLAQAAARDEMAADVALEAVVKRRKLKKKRAQKVGRLDLGITQDSNPPEAVGSSAVAQDQQSVEREEIQVEAAAAAMEEDVAELVPMRTRRRDKNKKTKKKKKKKKQSMGSKNKKKKKPAIT